MLFVACVEKSIWMTGDRTESSIKNVSQSESHFHTGSPYTVAICRTIKPFFRMKFHRTIYSKILQNFSEGTVEVILVKLILYLFLPAKFKHQFCPLIGASF